MSTTLHLPYVRFIRQYNTEVATNTAYLATLARAVEGLKATAWREAVAGTAVEMPLSNPQLSFTADAYDVFKASGDAATGSGKQAAYVGMVAYRYTLPTDAFVATTAKVVSVTFTAYADKFNWRGLLVSAYLSNSANPPADWDLLAAGDVATAIDVDGNGILPDAAPATATATNKSGVFTLTWPASTEPKTYLYIILQQADWLACKWEYWIEGAGMIDGATLAVTFSRDVMEDTEAPDSIHIASGGTITAPLPDGASTCLVAARELPIGTSTSTAQPTATEALAAIPALFARLASLGAAQLPLDIPPVVQTGLSCLIVRRIAEGATPFVQQLDYLASALVLLACFPNGYTPRKLTLTHRSGLSPVVTSGATVTVAAYWVAGIELSVAAAGQLSASAAAQFADSKITIGATNAVRVGTAQLPPSLAGGDSVTLPLSGLTGRWGTLLLVATIERVTATGLDVDVPIGMLGIVRDNSTTLSGSGWMPDVIVSKQ